MTQAEFIQQYILKVIESGQRPTYDLVDYAAELWKRIDSRYGE